MDSRGEIVRQFPDDEPKWMDTLRMLAKDKRFEWFPGMARYWTEKLKAYPGPIVNAVLLQIHWTLFPSTDEVIEELETLRETWRQERDDDAWQHWKLEQERAARDGLLATDEDYAELRKGLDALARSKPMAQTKPGAARATTYEPLTDAQFRDRKEILRQQIAQIEASRK